MAENEAKPVSNWSETRTVIVCWMMLSCFIIIYLFWLSPPNAAESQLLNTLVGIYFGTGLVTAIQWWMGSAKGSDANNEMQKKMSDAFRSALPPPVAPDVVVAWWSILTDAEREAITTASLTDTRAAAFVTASATGNATLADLDYLVAKDLLTRDRATAIAALSVVSNDTLKTAAVAAAAAAAPAAAAAVAPAAAAAVAAAAAAAVAPAAAAVVAPPAANTAAPPAARKAVAEAMAEQGLTPTKPKELP